MNSPQFNKRLRSSAKWSVIGRVGTLGGSLLISVLVARALGKDLFGNYMLIYSAIMLLMNFALSGLPLSVLREMRMAKATIGNRAPLPVVDQALGIVGLMCLGLVLLLSTVVLALDDQLYGGLFRDYLPQMALWFLAASANLMLGEIFRGYSDFRSAALLEGQFGGLATTGMFLLIAMPLIAFSKFDLATALWIQVIAAAVSALFGSYRLLRIQSVTIRFRSREYRQAAWCLFLDSMPVALTNLTSSSMWYIELLLGGFWLPKPDLALYGLANQLTRVVSQPLRLVNQSVLPFVADLHAAGDRPAMEKLLRGSATLATLLSIPLLLALLLFPGWILSTCYGPEYATGGWVLQIVAIGTFVSVCVGGTGLTLVMTGHQTAQLRLTALITTVYLCIAPPVIYWFGLQGLVGLSSLLVIVRSAATLILVYAKLKILTLADFRWSVLKSSFNKISRRIKGRPTRQASPSMPPEKEVN